MNIGIDIDNTLTDIEKDLFDIANKYTKKINPNFEYKNPIKFDGFTNMSTFYINIFGWNTEQVESFFRNERIEVVDKALPRPGVVDVLKKLKDKGNNIYIVTARTDRYDDMPYERAKTWLDKNGIIYDKLIVGATDKVKVCKELGIDVFIDDQLNNCMKISQSGITTIRLTNSKEEYDHVINMSNFTQIFEYICSLK